MANIGLKPLKRIFQKLLQISSSGEIADATGSAIGQSIPPEGGLIVSGTITADSLNVGGGIGGAGLHATDITASGNISASGYVIADSFQSTGGDDQISFEDNLSIVGDVVISDDLNVGGKMTASALLIESDDMTADKIENFFLIKSGSFDALKVNEESVLVLGGFEEEPEAVPGGLYYHDDNDEFYAGKKDE